MAGLLLKTNWLPDGRRHQAPRTSVEPLRKALAHRNNYIVAKAADLAREFRLTELVPELLAAFGCRVAAGGNPRMVVAPTRQPLRLKGLSVVLAPQFGPRQGRSLLGPVSP